MTVSVRLNEEDENDLKSYEKAIKEYKRNPKTYTLDEVKKSWDYR